ncbi:tape measure protein [Apilactobacillus ozensis]|uniref:tape measure protein n=1 Tax=Apilactobacillus ozensis TaxID=866801 RepID=UPI0007055A34|nr:tape measure protein [Apilactobacillus ozensis]
MAENLNTKINIVDGFSNPLSAFASKLSNSSSKLSELSNKFTQAKSKVTGMITGANKGAEAWTNFSNKLGSMNIPTAQIGAAKNELSGFARQTNTSIDGISKAYVNLSRAGVSNTSQLTQSLASLANATNSPKSSLILLSETAAKMAKQPKVQWQDFNDLLNTMPNTMSRVASSMNTSMSDLISNIKNGKVQTEQFISALNQAGNRNNLTPKTPQEPKSAGIGGGGMFKSMLGANLASSAVVGGLNLARSAVTSLNEELSSSTKAWDTFNGNMQQLNMPQAKINSVRNELQKFAQDTIYSSSDMASTYSQLEATGTKNTTQLVKGFGGLAAASSEPTQAMKTLSQQATQMAAKPKVQWQDFKLMMEQTPAGISAVAKSMNMSMSELMQGVQGGTVKTQDFFNAIEKTGNNRVFSKMATEYKTVDQAMDGMKETIANRLQPAYDTLGKVAIKHLSGITDKIGDINLDSAAKKLAPAIDNGLSVVESTLSKITGAVGAFWGSLVDTGAANNVMNMLGSISGAIGHVFDSGAGGKKDPFAAFRTIGGIAGGAINGLAGAISAIANAVKNLNPNVIKVFAGAMLVLKMSAKGWAITGIVVGLNLLSKLNPSALNVLAYGLMFLAGAIAIYKTLTGVVSIFGMLKNGISSLGSGGALKSASTGATQAAGSFIKLGAAVILIGAGVALAGVGLWIMANAAISLANAGWPAVAVMVGMVAVIALIGTAVTVAGTAMIGGAVGFAIFGAALILVSIAVFIVAAGITLLATQLPNIANYGMMAAINLMALGVAMMTFSVLAIAASVGIVVLSAALLIGAVAMTVAAVGAVILGAGAMVLGAGLMFAGAGAMVLAAGIAAVAVAFGILVTVVAGAINGVVSAVRNGMNMVKNAVSSGIQGAVSIARGFGGALVGAGHAIINGFLNGIKSAFEGVKSFVSGIAGWIKAHKGPLSYDRKLLNPAGNLIMDGLNNGLNDGFSQVKGTINGITNHIAGTQMPDLQAGDIAKYNAGDSLTGSFGNALSMVGNIKKAMNGLSSKDLNVNANTNFNSSNMAQSIPNQNINNSGVVGANSVPYDSSLSTAQASGVVNNSYSKSDKSSNNEHHIHIENGAIQINSSGNANYDAETLVEMVENYLIKKNTGMLSN